MVIVWQGLRIETSVMVLGASVVAAVIVLILLYGLVRAILRSPFLLSRHLRRRALRGANAEAQPQSRGASPMTLVREANFPLCPPSNDQSRYSRPLALTRRSPARFLASTGGPMPLV